MANIKKIKSLEELNKCLSDNSKIALKFSADWCGPCQMTSNNIRSIKEEDLNGFKFFEINIDDEFAKGLCDKYQILSIPVILYFKNGNIAFRSVGMKQAAKIIEIINGL